jgi:archaellum component FlaG (FlaF/FlaG flagellin family)
MKKFPKAILERINLINSMIDAVNDADDIPYTYGGGTYPYYVIIKPITIHNQFVTIVGDKNSFVDGKERYNVNKVTTFGDDNCRGHLNYTLSIILKAFKKVL